MLVSHDREFLARCVTEVLELDLAQHSHRLYGGGYEAYLEERSTVRRHARERYEEFAQKKADLVDRARTQREWSSQGVRNAMRKAPDNDRIRRRAQTESSERSAFAWPMTASLAACWQARTAASGSSGRVWRAQLVTV